MADSRTGSLGGAKLRKRESPGEETPMDEGDDDGPPAGTPPAAPSSGRQYSDLDIDSLLDKLKSDMVAVVDRSTKNMATEPFDRVFSTVKALDQKVDNKYNEFHEHLQTVDIALDKQADENQKI